MKERLKSVSGGRMAVLWAVPAVIVCIAAVCLTANMHKEIPPEAVSAVTLQPDTAVSDDHARQLVTLINESGRSIRPVGLDDPNALSAAVQIDCADGGMYLLHYQYYSGFSFHPTHPGEDDYRSILTYFSPDGKKKRAWRLEYGFDTAFREWYDAVKQAADAELKADALAYASALTDAFADIYSSGSSASNITHLEKIAVSPDGEKVLYRLKFWVTKSLNGLEGTPPEDVYRGDVYFSMMLRAEIGTQSRKRIGYIIADELEAKYNTAEMIGRYGDPYIAAAAELDGPQYPAR